MGMGSELFNIMSKDLDMEYKTISIKRLSPHIGAEIGQVDLTRPLPEEQIKEIKQALLDYQVIFFRDQKISINDKDAFASHFGSVGKHVGVNTISKTMENPLVRKFHYDETSKQISGENFHSDQSCAEVPPLGSMLYNHTMPPHSGG